MTRAPNFSALPDWGTRERPLTKLDRGSLALDSESVLGVDINMMSATAVISTPTPDRVRDSMSSSGCKLDNYRKNPVVFWEHGLGGITLPIAKSEDPNGKLSIAISDSQVIGTSFFTNKLLEAEQIFELIVDGIIRATSIRFNPIKSSIHREDGEDTFGIEEWDLEEWSWVSVPCNPEAVTGVIAKGRLAGKRISEPILKSLQLWLPKRAVMARGWEPEPEAEDVAKTNKPGAKPKTKADKPDDEEPEDETPAGGADQTPADETPPEDEPADDIDEPKDEADVSQLPGARLLSGTHAGLSELLNVIATGRSQQENPKVQKGIDAVMPLLEKAASILEGCYSDNYGELSSPAKSATHGEQLKLMNEYLERGNAPRLQLKAFAARMLSLSKEKNITADQRRKLDKTASQLNAMVDEALAESKASAASQPVPSPEVLKTLENLKQQFDSLKKSLDDVRPASGMRVVG